MLEKPALQDENIITCLQEDYRLTIVDLAFLPLGADLNTAVYRGVADDGTPYFIKLRRTTDFAESAVTIPKFLSDTGIKQIIPPLTTQTGQLWARLNAFNVILYPFVQGANGFEIDLSDQQRIEFGQALKQLHTANIPPALTQHIQRETFSSRWRDTVKLFLGRIQHEIFQEPVARALAAFLRTKRNDILTLVNRAERLAAAFQAQSPELIVCHADIHAWNLLIDIEGRLYLVDWDTLIFAPKERDLMFVGTGLGGNGHTLQEEVTLFYQGYGPAQVDLTGLAYYRYERIIEDIAVYCEQIFLSDEGGEDRKRSLDYLKSNFLPKGTIAIARQLDEGVEA